jgi:hypothetical protein
MTADVDLVIAADVDQALSLNRRELRRGLFLTRLRLIIMSSDAFSVVM